MPVESLNPYSDGRYSMSWVLMLKVVPVLMGLNPYSNGRYSMRQASVKVNGVWHTSLNPYSIGRYSMGMLKILLGAALGVIILILMEDTLWE